MADREELAGLLKEKVPEDQMQKVKHKTCGGCGRQFSHRADYPDPEHCPWGCTVDDE